MCDQAMMCARCDRGTGGPCPRCVAFSLMSRTAPPIKVHTRRGPAKEKDACACSAEPEGAHRIKRTVMLSEGLVYKWVESAPAIYQELEGIAEPPIATTRFRRPCGRCYFSRKGCMTLMTFQNLGVNLARYLSRNPGLGCAQRASIVGIVAKILAQAERQGIIHNDVKPENVVVQNLGGELSVHVIDWDMASKASVVSRFETATARWRTPARLFRHSVQEPSADVYSMGLMAIQVIMGCKIPLPMDNVKEQFLEEWPFVPSSLEDDWVYRASVFDTMCFHGLNSLQRVIPQTSYVFNYCMSFADKCDEHRQTLIDEGFAPCLEQILPDVLFRAISHDPSERPTMADLDRWFEHNAGFDWDTPHRLLFASRTGV